MLNVMVVLSAAAVVTIALRLQPRPRRPAAGGEGHSPAAMGWVPVAADRTVTAIRDRRRRRAGIDPGAVADWCGDLSRSIRAGHAMRVALERTLPNHGELRRATEPIRLGLSRGSAVAEAVSDVEFGQVGGGRGHLALACSVLEVCGRSGGSGAAPLDRVAAALRQRSADDRERAAHAAQSRLSANVMTLVPVGVLGLLVVADDAIRSAVASPAGAGCVLAGAGLNLTGWWWMRRIIRRDG